MLVLLSNFDAFVPSMKLLVHGHSLFNLIMLDQNCFSLVELLVEYSHLGLHAEVFRSLSGNQLVQLAKVVGFCNITECGVAAFSNVKILLLHGKFGQSLPVGFCLGSQVKRLQDVDCRI